MGKENEPGSSPDFNGEQADDYSGLAIENIKARIAIARAGLGEISSEQLHQLMPPDYNFQKELDGLKKELERRKGRSE